MLGDGVKLGVGAVTDGPILGLALGARTDGAERTCASARELKATKPMAKAKVIWTERRNIRMALLLKN